MDDLLVKIIQVIAYIAPYFLIPATFKAGLGVFGNLAGIVNDRSRGLFDRQKKYRSGKRAEGIHNFKSGSGEGRLRQTALIRGAGRRVSGGLRGNIGPNAKIYREARWDSVGGNAAAEFMKSPAFQAQSENDNVLRAAAVGKTRAESISNMQRIYGFSQADAEKHVTAAQATIGLGRQQQIAAAQQLVNTGTGYDNIEQMAKTLAVAADGSLETGNRLAGFANYATKKAGRWDMAAGFGTVSSLVEGEIKGGADAPTQVKYDQATVQAVRSSTDSRTLAATSKSQVFKNINSVAGRARSTVVQMDDSTRAQFIQDLTATAIEARSNISSMSQDNASLTNTLINQVGDETIRNYGPGMVEDGKARVYRQTDPVTGKEKEYGYDPNRPDRRPPDSDN